MPSIHIAVRNVIAFLWVSGVCLVWVFVCLGCPGVGHPGVRCQVSGVRCLFGQSVCLSWVFSVSGSSERCDRGFQGLAIQGDVFQGVLFVFVLV